MGSPQYRITLKVAPPLHLTLYTLHQKNRIKMRFFLHIRKFCSTFAPVMSPRLGIMSLRGAVTRHNKRRHNALCSWLFGTWKILNHPRHCSILMSSGYVYPYLCTPWTRCVHNCTYRRGLRCCLFR